MDLNEKIGDWLFRKRMGKDVGQGAAARAMGISRHTLINIEYGRNAVTFANVIKLMGVLGLTFSDFDDYFKEERKHYATKYAKRNVDDCG